MRLLIDEDVPQSAIDFLRERGHEVIEVREQVLPATADEVIALLGEEVDAIVVTCNARHFKHLISKVPHGARRQFRRVGRIAMECSQAQVRSRLEALIESIEFEYTQAQRRNDKRVMIEIGNTVFRVQA